MKHKLHKLMAMFVASIFAVSAWAQQDYTSAIKNAAVTSKDEWNAEGASFGTPAKKDELVKYGSGKLVDFNQTITIPAGKYKMTAKAVYRYTGSEQSEYEAIQAGTNTHLAKLYAETSSYKYETNVMNRWEGASDTDYAAGNGSVTVNGKFVPNSSAAVKVWFDNGMYVNELVFNVQADGEVKIGIETKETVPGGEYTNISAWTLTRLGDAEADPKEEEPEPEEPGEESWVPSEVAEGTFYLYNVDKGVFMNRGNDWGTRASGLETGEPITLVAEGEQYLLKTGNGNTAVFYADNGVWMDGGDLNDASRTFRWNVAMLPDGFYTLVPNGKSQALGMWADTPDNTRLDARFSATGTRHDDAPVRWALYTKKQYDAAQANVAASISVRASLRPYILSARSMGFTSEEIDAFYNINSTKEVLEAALAALPTKLLNYAKENGSESKPMDISFLIKNAYCVSLDSWTSVGDSWVTNGWNFQENGDACGWGIYLERWVGSDGSLADSELYQTLTGLPVGEYTLQVDACAALQNGSKSEVTGVQLYAEAYEPSSTTISTPEEKPETWTTSFVTIDGQAKVGFKRESTTANWLMFDNFKLYYKGVTVEVLKISLDEALTKAKAIDQAKLSEGLKELLSTAIAEGENAKSSNEKTVVEVATNNLIAALAAIAEVETAISQLEEKIKVYEGYLNNSISNEAVKDAFASAIENSKSVKATAVSAADVNAAIATLEKACQEFFMNAVPTEGTVFDVTFAIQNPNFDKNVEGWTCVKANHNGGEGYNGVGGIVEIAEWGADSWEASISQTITGLPNGKYLVKMAWMAANGIGMTLSANDASVDVVGIGDQGGNIAKDGAVVEKGKGHRGWQYAEVEAEVILGKLTIMVSSSATTKTMWSNADAFELYCIGAVEAATEAQKAEFAAALAEAENHVLGFAKDEYAPYTNLEAVKALLDAQALNLENASAEGVEQVLAALKAAVWTANAEDMSIIYNGSFDVVAEGANYPLGWTRTNGWGQMQTNVTGCDNGTAYYNQPGSLVYGSTGAYLMPLKANATYKLTFKYRSHEEGDKANKGVVATVALGEKSVEVCKAEANPSKTDWMVGEGEFETTEAGNYILTLANSENTWMTDVVLVQVAGDDTGISAPAMQNVETIIYDLQGRRVQKMEKGLYIVNGRKVLVK
jgi:hypothetical protein